MPLPARQTAAVAAAALLAGGLAACGGGAPPAHLSGAAAAAVAAKPKLVVPVNFPDPDVLRAGTGFYAYATNAGGKNMPVASAASAKGAWTVRAADGLPKLGAWAAKGRTWAPDVSRRADGRYVLYYTAHHKARNQQCLGVALATSPAGPFTPVGKSALVCGAPKGATHGALRGEIIDASSFVDGGRRYLLYKVGYNAYGKTSFLALQRMSADGLTKVGAAKVVLTQTTEPYTVEAPDLVRAGKRFVLFYAAGVFSKNNYQTRYAVASKVGGPYRKAAKPLMTTAGLGRQVNGPGGAGAVYDAGAWRIFFHGAIVPGAHPHPDPAAQPKNLVRGMYVADLKWTSGGTPYVR
ncbi:glycoside hydrolase family 43 protein [Actinomadura parmotrematis]|uniref:Glycoside hydrolase family 43 protein n=1 Tax=Actinomadura parmotrematis TaxID=2864039 RepID=A0ABS7FZE3_9ACTN|nr:glycoside hydrolase family 43 protein [Actinomadura parmotrematis]MBW8485310.1 glycoside hydrolase family 43 protein [Actinomadura parmotrematis]